MKKWLLLLVSTGTILLLLNRCSQYIPITGPYKDIPIVYGILDQQDAVHYVRIQKGYLLKGSAYVAGGISDSIYYPDILKVTIQASPNGPTYRLTRVDGTNINLPKDSGSFANTPNILYSFTGGLDSSKTYILTITDTTSGKTVSAQTGLVQNFQVFTPIYGQTISLSNTTPAKIIFAPATNGLIYDLTVRFNYQEYNVNNPSQIKDSFVDIAFLRSYDLNTSLGQTSIPITFTPAILYGSLVNSIPINNNVYRLFDIHKGMQFKFAVGGPDLANYLNSQQAQSGLTSTEILPPYTNITNGGYGIFSSRYFAEVDSVLLTNDGIDSLACNSISNPLRFLNHNKQLCH